MKTKAVVCIIGVAAVATAYWLGYQHGRSTLQTPNAGPQQVTGLSREQILQMLPGKTWFKHWETRDRNRPTRLIVDTNGAVFVEETMKEWKLESRWVLNEGEHLFIPIDEYSLRGFFIPSGRQKGYFADQPK